MDRNFTILQNVARDLAVVKNEIEHQTKAIGELKETLKQKLPIQVILIWLRKRY